MLRLRETSSHPSMKGATINLLLILNSASTMLKRAPPEIVWVMLSPSGRGIPLRAGSPRCCNERRGSPAKSRLPRPDGLLHAPRLRPSQEGLDATGQRHGGTH